MNDLRHTDSEITERIKLPITPENRLDTEILFTKIKLQYLIAIKETGLTPDLTCRLKYINDLLDILSEFDDIEEFCLNS